MYILQLKGNVSNTCVSKFNKNLHHVHNTITTMLVRMWYESAVMVDCYCFRVTYLCIKVNLVGN